MKKQLFVVLFLLLSGNIFAQGTFSGDYMMNLNFYMEDTNIDASNNPLYENALSGSDAWLTMRYAINGFTFFARADGYANSNLKNPVSPNTDFGIGAWSITKEFDDLTIHVGSIYDQIGSGILFRTYEDRGLLIDNALMGAELKYKFSKNFSMKGFAGQLKNNNSDNNLVNNVRYLPVIKGLSGEGDVSIGDVNLTPGFGVLNRTLDAANMSQIVSSINSQPVDTRFIPKYNMYAFTGYNTLSYKNLSWYVEGAYKTNEAILLNDNLLHDEDGTVLYTNMSYGMKGIAVSLMGKRTDNFVMRTSPNESLLRGLLNWQPIIAIMRPMRLMSRYAPASQDLSEQAATANASISPNDMTSINLTYTASNTLKNDKLYREVMGEITYHGLDKWILEGGIQYMEYNVLLYQNRSTSEKYPIQYAFTPFAEVTYKFNEKKSLLFEAQYMQADNDYGSWAFALLEYNIAPKWSFAVSDMYNVNPNPKADNPNFKDPGNHYYQFFTAYTKGPHRFTMAYVKQVDGINCTGGVCRYEPAFSGVKATLNTTF